jgi:hypothetical protein
MLRSIVSLAVAGFVITTFACSSKVCSSSEESACTSTYTDCINKAAAAADHAACLKCVDDYCTCYGSCGNTCDKAKLQGTCP